MTLEHCGMTFYVEPTDDGLYDVADVAGSRPLGLRSSGPWETEDEAAAAVRGMSQEEVNE